MKKSGHRCQLAMFSCQIFFITSVSIALSFLLMYHTQPLTELLTNEVASNILHPLFWNRSSKKQLLCVCVWVYVRYPSPVWHLARIPSVQQSPSPTVATEVSIFVFSPHTSCCVPLWPVLLSLSPNMKRAPSSFLLFSTTLSSIRIHF